MQIGTIGNYYGCLKVQEDNGKYYWCIENWDGDYWEEIPKYLYSALVKYQKSLEKS